YKNLFSDESEKMEEYEQKNTDLGSSEELTNILARLKEWEEYVTAEVFDVYDSGKEDLANENLANVASTAKDLAVDLDELASGREEVINQSANDMISSGEASLVVGIAITLSVLIIGVVAAVLTSHTISRPVKLLMNR